jgi:alpha-tubulin suppressor-like RCC1 family protein
VSTSDRTTSSAVALPLVIVWLVGCNAVLGLGERPGLADGARCDSSSDCDSGFCVAGTCCNRACGGVCESCQSPGSEGRCTRAPVGHTCGNGLACDALGECLPAPAANGVPCTTPKECMSQLCVNQICCERACSASEVCTAAGRCSGKNGSPCASAVDCGSGHCVDGVCCQKPCAAGERCGVDGLCRLAVGQACLNDAECDSTFCVDGRCCDSACVGPCRACNATSKEGSCTLSAEGSDPDAECAASCDGNGACRLVTKIAAGTYHACALLNDGTVRCWGDFQPSKTIDVGGAAKELGAGENHDCAALTSGAVKCWGANDSGQLGNGSLAPSKSGVSVSGIDGIAASAKAVAAGYAFSCALLTSGAVRCWGANDSGELGAGSTLAESATPLGVAGIDGTAAAATAIALGDGHACAIVADGSVRCWGANDYGQLGAAIAVKSAVPVTVGGLGAGAKAVAIAAGEGHTCAVLQTGGIKCWGRNDEGQLGNGNYTPGTKPVAVVGIDGMKASASSVALGTFHSCALTSTGIVKCWGANYAGELGSGSSTGEPTPVDCVVLKGAGVAQAISVGDSFSCALLSTGTVRCFGLNNAGQLGKGVAGKVPL